MAHSRSIPFLFFGLVVLSVELTSAFCLHYLAAQKGFQYQFVSDLYPTKNLRSAILSKLERQNVDTGHVRMDAQLGWALRPGGVGYEAGRPNLYHVNAQGFRGTGAGLPLAATGVTRILALGDSFTFGNEVEDSYAWPAVLDSLLPNAQVLNAGVPGYGNDQAYLLSQRLVPTTKPNIVFLGFQPENTNRNVSVLRAFYTNEHYLPFTKPRFFLENGALRLQENPLRELEDYVWAYENPQESFRMLGTHDSYYKRHLAHWPVLDASPTVRLLRVAWLHAFPQDPVLVNGMYSEHTEAVQITLALFNTWYAQVEASGATPVIVVLPNSFITEEKQNTNRNKHEVFLQHWQQKGMRVVDLTIPIAEDPRGIPELYLSGGHYSPAANALVAEYLAAYLRKENLVK